MKISAILAATILVAAAPLAMATPAIQKEAKKAKCTDCHTAVSGLTKADPKLNDEGKKFVKK
jgi:cytochrome c2